MLVYLLEFHSLCQNRQSHGRGRLYRPFTGIAPFLRLHLRIVNVFKYPSFVFERWLGFFSLFIVGCNILGWCGFYYIFAWWNFDFKMNFIQDVNSLCNVVDAKFALCRNCYFEFFFFIPDAWLPCFFLLSFYFLWLASKFLLLSYFFDSLLSVSLLNSFSWVGKLYYPYGKLLLLKNLA